MTMNRFAVSYSTTRALFALAAAALIACAQIQHASAREILEKKERGPALGGPRKKCRVLDIADSTWNCVDQFLEYTPESLAPNIPDDERFTFQRALPYVVKIGEQQGSTYRTFANFPDSIIDGCEVCLTEIDSACTFKPFGKKKNGASVEGQCAAVNGAEVSEAYFSSIPRDSCRPKVFTAVSYNTANSDPLRLGVSFASSLKCIRKGN